MRKIVQWLAGVVLVIVFVIVSGSAPSASDVQEHREKMHYRNRLELFLGNSHDGDEDGFTTGLVYEYRLHQLIGVGGLVEYAAGDFDEWIYAVPILMHPYKGLRFVGAPGIADKEGGNEFLFRAGVAYEFHFDRWSVSPEVAMDFVDGEEVWLFGLLFGIGF